MYPQNMSLRKSRRRAQELVRKVGNVVTGRILGTVSDTQASEIFHEIVSSNEDLVLQEHEDPDIKEAMRKVRITLLPFSDKPFAVCSHKL